MLVSGRSCRSLGYQMSGSFTSSSLRAAFSHCVQQVRSYDYHHYLCLLELPPIMRKVAFALRAFNVETSRAMDVSSDPKIGLMRLLWWQERSVQARVKDARKQPNEIPETMEELEKYAEDTLATILYMTLEAGGIRSTTADHAASHVAKAGGILLLLRSLPYHANRHRHSLYITRKIAEKHGLLVEKAGQKEIRIDSRESLCEAVFEMASVANSHLEKARELAGTVPREALPVILLSVPAQVLLDSLRKVQFDVFDPRLGRGVLGISPLWYQLKVKWTSWSGKYSTFVARTCFLKLP
ncbi:hypothetical protein SAY86_003823 [Trapa natans]|uniref:NADH dehydrogenase (Ubiquinone) complex I, assembly factor 6 n=1 Tax=Trapa natans TaxID=22666 RepID=A0AAN7N2J2_TRANT|nr:hypothetical protein SAY86_003823 [Trapa natans]